MADLSSKQVESPARAVEDTAGSATAATNLAWAEAFVSALEERGVRDACVCSGSRSAPLVLALHRSSIRTHVALDERAGAFFALGLAKASRRPVAILTTSGTAAANLHPAAVEAHHARVPLILLTADRPPELRDAGASQTIDQIRMFGTAARWFHEVGVPVAEPDLIQYAAALGARAVAEAWGPPAGPVHLNFAFREPLVPDPESLGPRPARRATADAAPADAAGGPAFPSPSTRDLTRAAGILRQRRRGLIVCGPEDAPPELPAAVARLAAVTGYPILADPASQVRYGPHDRSRVLGAYDAFLRAPGFAAREAPEVVIQFGPALTSKSYHLYAARHPGAVHLLVDPARGWRSPSRRAREVFAADPTAFASALADSLARGSDPLPRWGETFDLAERSARDAIGRRRASVPDPSEGYLFPALLDSAPEGTLVYVGNSLAIRNLDLFAPSSSKRLRILANRGASGIDGVISSGLGAGAAGDFPVLIVTGDLSFHHDLNGLAAAREGNARATIVIVNNDGGGVFSLLPIARHGEVFERYFGTPHGLDFAPAAAMYRIPFARPDSLAALGARAASSLARRVTEILEVRSDREETRALHQIVRADAIRAVEETL
ncbi:MAG TPA: 2-succinyl-5-enolpyruvyl-6-hydroxy-3-cyclohexene-1-carboxylic-acid synthase [Candidatus Dormibacteraeota bacterium]|nr:2-succinyl-5-enolpyruvyl-6-hydroxy-3-cyclohexene-1-carboxylic-acid synthase [Candidatus Dormibacteraeota bacterium]